MHESAGVGRRAGVLLLWSALVALAVACGGDPAAGRAGRTVGAGWRALAEVERTMGGENAEAEEVLQGQPEHARAELRAAIVSAHQRLRDAEEVVTIWQDTGTGRISWYTYAPCLAASLARLRDAVEAVDLAAPAELHQAETMAEEDATGRCADEQERQLVSPGGPGGAGLDAPPEGGN